MPEKSALITALLLDRHMCIDCIGTKTSLANGAVEAYLAVMARVLSIRRAIDECGSCGATTEVVTMERLS